MPSPFSYKRKRLDELTEAEAREALADLAREPRGFTEEQHKIFHARAVDVRAELTRRAHV